jgi:hypothetical protein
MKTPHTSCQRGKRVKLGLRNGESICGRFVERTGKFIVLDVGRYRGSEISSFSIIGIARI